MPTNSPGVDANVLVSYTPIHQDFVEKFLLVRLRKAGIKVWSERPNSTSSADSLRAKVLLSCKVYLPVLCSMSVLDPPIQDEVALAYIANKSIIPLGREFHRKVNANTPSGIKLMLAKINWTFFVKEESFEDNITQLINVINEEVEAASVALHDGPETEEEVYEALNHHAPGIAPPDTSVQAEEQQLQPQAICEHTDTVLNCGFWERNFNDKKEVLWTEFKDVFLKEYEEKILQQLGEDKIKWMLNVLYKDILDLNKTIKRSLYSQFCGKNPHSDPHHFYERLKEYCTGSYAIREVFHMDSTVRLHAIQNLGTFNSPAVITLLFDLVTDNDPNTRAVAALALAKTGKKYRRISDHLIKMLTDEDRVVRESACLSLAHMKCTQAVPHIVDLWRNDAIKHVREAAELALSRIGGAEAEKAIRVTKVLSDEMNSLRAKREN